MELISGCSGLRVLCLDILPVIINMLVELVEDLLVGSDSLGLVLKVLELIVVEGALEQVIDDLLRLIVLFDLVIKSVNVALSGLFKMFGPVFEFELPVILDLSSLSMSLIESSLSIFEEGEDIRWPLLSLILHNAGTQHLLVVVVI